MRKICGISQRLLSDILNNSLNLNGAVEWSRTTDLLITNQLLYQLSYNSTERNNLRKRIIANQSVGSTSGAEPIQAPPKSPTSENA